MFKAIAFDFDGVLFESVDVKTRAFQALFPGESPEVLEKVKRYHLENGGGNRWDKIRAIYREILNRPLTEEALKAHCDRFASFVVQEVIASPWVEGAREFLDRFKNRYAYFVVSAPPDDEIKDIVKRKGIEPYFKDVLGAPRKKDLLLSEIMDRHTLSPTELVYVGDAINDWQAAQRVGVPFIWRRASDDIPILKGFGGPWVYTLSLLDDRIAHLSS
jgi:phosphoglycolate phosphatase-like HAD superfamily hydrolase